MPTPLTLCSEPEAIRFAGGLDLYSAEQARTELLACLAARPALTLDLSQVSDCDAAGWQLLIALRKSAAAAGKSFSIQARSPAIEECARLLGLTCEGERPLTL
jgi:anti-anti-sigma factor